MSTSGQSPEGSPQYVAAQTVQEPPRRPASGGSLGRTLFRLLMLCFVLSLPVLVIVVLVLSVGGSLGSGTGSIDEKKYLTRRWDGDKKIAVVSIEGTIISGEGFPRKQIEKVIKDKDVVAVVLRVDSPGGTITGSDYILHHLKEMRQLRSQDGEPLPLVVSMGGLAASGGYYVSMAVEDTPDSIFAEPTTWTGSIGVIIPHYNAAGLMKEIGVSQDSVVSHDLKGMGSITREMKPEERAIFQGLVDEAFTRFKDIILVGRPNLSADELDKLATGQVFTTDQALKSGLVDKVGFLEDAVERAIQLAGLTDDDVQVVQYQQQPTLADVLMIQSNQKPPEVQALMDLATPRAWYVCTWLPGSLTAN